MMNDQKADLIERMFAYNLWANCQLIEVCKGLNEEQLEMEVVGVFGRVQRTLHHLVQAEGGYINRMTGSRPWAEGLDWDGMSMNELYEKAWVSGEKLVEIAGRVDPNVQHEVEWQGEAFRFFHWTVLLQALYHSIEHRTQIKILLTHLGVEHPDLDAWGYTEAFLEEKGDEKP